MGESRFGRRALLGAAALTALGTATGCTSGNGMSGPTSPTGSLSTTAPPPSTSSTTATAANTSADVDLVTSAIDDERVALQAARRARLQYPRLAAEVDPLVGILVAHIRVFSATLPPGTSSSTVPGVGSAGSIQAARAELTSTVTSLARRRTQDCLRAEAGPLAALFASAAASHRSILATWTTS